MRIIKMVSNKDLMKVYKNSELYNFLLFEVPSVKGQEKLDKLILDFARKIITSITCLSIDEFK